MTRSEGFKDSRIKGVKLFSWNLFFKTKRGKKSEKTGFATHGKSGFKLPRSNLKIRNVGVFFNISIYTIIPSLLS